MEIQYDAASLILRPTRRISPKEDKHYKELLQKFEEKFRLDRDRFKTVEYIVSTDFLNQWREFCLSHDEVRQVPNVMNASLFDPKTKKLRPGLREREDMQFLSEETYELLKEWHCNQLKRTTEKLGNEKRVPLNLREYSYLVITNNDLKLIDQKIKRRKNYELKIIQQSQNAVAKDLVDKVFSKDELPHYTEGRLWKVDKKQTLDSLFKYLRKAADRANYEYRIKGFGKRLANEVKIEDLKMEEGDFFVVEVRDKSKRWFLQTETEKKCEGCYDIAELKFPCQCEKVAYCSQQCKDKDKRFHLRYCEYAELEMKLTSSSSRGHVGLRNLGNTCFMNSCLQCLSNTEPLTFYFLKSLYEKQVNKVNPLGTKGKLAKNYAKFIKGMWCDSDSVFTPESIKSAVSSINPMFSGYSQHDSQEFFSFLVDGLHEDLNRIEKKPYVESVESNNRHDKEVAVESWAAHLRRNQSIVTDLMVGQSKLKILCPTCNNESTTFHSFSTLSLPIPQTMVNIFDGFFIYSNFETKTKRFNFTYSKPNVDEWIKTISTNLSVDPNSINVYLVSMNEGVYKAGRQSLSEIIYKAEIESKNIFVVQMNEEEMGMKDRVEITGRFSKMSQQNDYDNLWFKFPFYFDKNASGLDIYKRMLRFLYNEAFNDNKSKKMFGKSYEEYENMMLTARPFQLHLRYGKRLDRFYNRLEYKFEEETPFGDKDTLTDFLKKTDVKDCELDMRFPKSVGENFNFEMLKDFDDITKKIQLQVRDKPIDIFDCFRNMSEPEQLEPGNEWFCSNCKENKLATKKINLFRAPKVLILHFKRFKQRGISRKEKNETRINFPLVLDLKDHVINPEPISDYANDPKIKELIVPPKYKGDYKITSSSEPIYDLYAVNNHYRGLGGGHYTAFAKNNGKWYEYNDSSVKGLTEESVVGSAAYILFYRRRD